MALVSINDAAKLVRKTRSTLSRDIEQGRLNRTILQDGDVRVDTLELLRAYGRLHDPQADQKKTVRASADKLKIARLEERNRALERVIVLEAELRRVKDQLTTELRQQLADKNRALAALENKVRALEFDRQLRDVPTLDLPDTSTNISNEANKPSHDGVLPWWQRVLSGATRKSR